MYSLYGLCQIIPYFGHWLSRSVSGNVCPIFGPGCIDLSRLIQGTGCIRLGSVELCPILQRFYTDLFRLLNALVCHGLYRAIYVELCPILARAV